MPASLMPLHLQAIPPALFLLVPLFPILLLLLAIAHPRHRHRQQLFLYWRPLRIVWSYFAIGSITVLAVLSGVLGVASRSLHLASAEALVATVLHFDLGASIIYLLVVSPSGTLSFFQRRLYNIYLAVILSCATLVSFITPFVPILPILAPIFRITFTVFTLPILTYTLLSSIPSNTPPPSPASSSSFPLSLTKPHEKLHETLDLPSSAVVEFSSVPPPDLDPDPDELQSRLRTRNIWIFALCSQISAFLAAIFDITALALVPAQLLSADPPQLLTAVYTEALIFRIIQTAFTVISAHCVMSAFLLHSYAMRIPIPLSGSNSLASFTPAPARIRPPSLRPQSRSSSFTSPRPRRIPLRLTRSQSAFLPKQPPHPFVPPPTPPLPPPPPPASPSPSQTTEDFLNLRDPFASPGIGAVQDPISNRDADGNNVDCEARSYHYVNKRTQRMSTWGRLPLPPPPPPSPVIKAQTPSSIGSSATGVAGGIVAGLGIKLGIPKKSPKAKGKLKRGREGRRGRGKERALKLSTSSSTLSSQHALISGPGSVGHDVDFDVEEALLAQRLLMRLLVVELEDGAMGQDVRGLDPGGGSNIGVEKVWEGIKRIEDGQKEVEVTDEAL